MVSKHTTYKHGDDWGMVKMIVLPTTIIYPDKSQLCLWFTAGSQGDMSFAKAEVIKMARTKMTAQMLGEAKGWRKVAFQWDLMVI
jgi:hypothetical protein